NLIVFWKSSPPITRISATIPNTMRFYRHRRRDDRGALAASRSAVARARSRKRHVSSFLVFAAVLFLILRSGGSKIDGEPSGGQDQFCGRQNAGKGFAHQFTPARYLSGGKK